MFIISFKTVLLYKIFLVNIIHYYNARPMKVKMYIYYCFIKYYENIFISKHFEYTLLNVLNQGLTLFLKIHKSTLTQA